MFPRDAHIGEKVAASGITNAIKVKSKFGMVLKTLKPSTPIEKIFEEILVLFSDEENTRKSARIFKYLEVFCEDQFSDSRISSRNLKILKDFLVFSSSENNMRIFSRIFSIGIILKNIVAETKKSMIPSNDGQTVIKSALRGARAVVKKADGKRNVNKPRILPVTKKVGGFLSFLIPKAVVKLPYRPQLMWIYLNMRNY